MKREIIKIDEELCTDCGDCIPNCHEGALQLIDGKARLISELFCDGLGACIGHCPEGAIAIEEREAEPYNETLVMVEIVKKGRNTILAHLNHLKDHGAEDYLSEAIAYIQNNNININADRPQVFEPRSINVYGKEQKISGGCGSGCHGSVPMSFDIDIDMEVPDEAVNSATAVEAPSELRQWPVQMHLLNPMAPYFRNADVVFAADCAAFSMGNFHNKFLKGRTVAIACPKLDSDQESYVQKLISMINDSQINSITVVRMQVPCCGGLTQMTQVAVANASRKIPIKQAIISPQGEVLQEDWI